MGLVTGTPLGSVISQNDIYLEGAPYVYFQDATASELNNPGSGSFYWGLSGTSTYPAYNLGCVLDVSLGENVTMNMVRCDTVGDKAAIQKRNRLELNLTITTLLPLSVLRHILKASAPVTMGSVEYMGIGPINNNLYYHVYLPKVYDEDTGDFISITLHRAQFADAFTINMRQGEPWQVTGVKLYAFADTTLPSAQQFATVIRADPSAVP